YGINSDPYPLAPVAHQLSDSHFVDYPGRQRVPVCRAYRGRCGGEIVAGQALGMGVGRGSHSISCRETRLCRLAGMMAPGKAVRPDPSELPVSGSYRGVPYAEKFPSRWSAVAMVTKRDTFHRRAVRSWLAKKNSLFRTIGPPSVRPYWF